MCEWIVEQLKLVNSFDGFLTDIVKSFLPVFLGVWLSVKLALRKFVDEKWWERKAEAYEKVISALYYSFRYYDEELHNQSGRNAPAKRTMDEILERSQKGDQDIIEAMTLGTLKLSQETIERLQEFRSNQEKATQAKSWTDHLMMAYDAHRGCLNDVIALAKKDLRIE